MKIKTVLFICGLGGDKGMTYVPELQKFCESKGYRFYAPHMPSFEDGITYDKYKKSFEDLLKKENIKNLQSALIIGQSAGTNFVVKYFGTKNINIGGYISCAGFSGPADQNLPEETKSRLSVVKSFYPTAIQYENFKKIHCKKVSIFGGKDCFFTVKNLSRYADNIGSEKVFDENGVHGTISENIKIHKLLHKVIDENF